MRVSLAKYLVNGRTAAVEIVLSGVAGLSDAPLLRKVLRGALREGCKVVYVNLLRVRDLDRACWDKLIAAARALRRAGGRMILRNCPESIAEEVRARRWTDFSIQTRYSPGGSGGGAGSSAPG